MEMVTTVTLEGGQTPLGPGWPAAAFSVLESSGGRAVVFASSLEDGEPSGPRGRADPAGPELCGAGGCGRGPLCECRCRLFAGACRRPGPRRSAESRLQLPAAHRAGAGRGFRSGELPGKCSRLVRFPGSAGLTGADALHLRGPPAPDSSSEDDDGAFPELPQCRGFLAGRRRRGELTRNGVGTGRDAVCNGGCRPESQEVLPPWSESMTQLMKKLDRLNLDIEEALSSGSSPSHTPGVTRKRLPDSAPGTTAHPALKESSALWTQDPEECRDQDSPPSPSHSAVGVPASYRKMEVAVKMSNERAEIEAKEACDWLRAAGFPQYAQLYEDSQFPIDISPVKKDHDFLDKDLVEPLCRRLNTLNKCASMKLDLNLPKKKSEDSDEEDVFAISDRWTFEWSSRRWSRLQDIDCFLGQVEGQGRAGGVSLRNAPSSESVLTDLSEPEVSSLHSGSSGGRSDPAAMPELASPAPPAPPHEYARYGSLPAKTGRHGRARAKDFLRRMEALRTWGPSSGAGRPGGARWSSAAPSCSRGPPPSRRCAARRSSTAARRRPRPGGPGKGARPAGRSAGRSGTCTSAAACTWRAWTCSGAAGGRGGDGLAQGRDVAERNRRNEFRSYEDLVVHVPKDHKPGTFPKALSIESLSPTNGASLNWHTGAGCCPRGSRVSVYDNVPGSHLYASTGDLMDLEKEDLFPHLDDILQHVNGLQQIVDHWSKTQITLDFEGNSVLEGQTTPSDGERDGVSLNETDSSGMRERRDSGVGASLTRPNRLRWPSFQISNRLSHSVASLQITNQSASQLSLLQKFSLLRLTAIMEKYSMSNKHGWTWSVPKFMKRMKVPDYKDKNVFGVPLIVHVQRSGQPLPLSLQQALKYLRSQCLDQVGLFRKSGVKSRIQALRQMNESSPDTVSYEDQSAYDVADMVKQFFRDLPEPLLTSKLGETFLHIYQYVPKEQRLQAVQAAIMLMSDENREVLQTLLCFLSDVTSSVEENQMTPMNIAVCLAPSLFHLNILKKDNLSPRAMQKKYSTGRPDQKDLNENLAATQGLAHMINECNRLFEIPHEMVTQSRNSYVDADLHPPTLEELCKQLEEDDGAYHTHADGPGAYHTHADGPGAYHTHTDGLVQRLLKEARDKSKGWASCSSTDNTELSYKKVGDGNPLRRWRVLVEWKVLETLDKQTEVYQYVLNRMPPHPSRDFLVLRSWRTDLPRGTCALVSVSVDQEDAPLLGGVRAVVLESQYLLEPCGSGKSRLTHICRVDLKGRTPEWYNKAFGHLCAAEAARIRNSFQPLTSEGPETKI
ncbi:hypothetical protein COCON_G00186080 [Conger conger]|uniref:StAR-related lipid transfer protein 13 n=1 Tax=Conger conger TaxID=82655 RepID=A0A9Q1HPX4_CONCO|nr:hypothetical protein COCON_G00186080 [Conger conger]